MFTAAFQKLMRHRSAIRKAQLEDLAKLLDEKREIEDEIVTSLRTVDQACTEISAQFMTVLRGRAHELE